MKFDKFDINLSIGMEKLMLAIKNRDISNGSPCGH
jgi:hypothetical protein